jgi:hypothetical protein
MQNYCCFISFIYSSTVHTKVISFYGDALVAGSAALADVQHPKFCEGPQQFILRIYLLMVQLKNVSCAKNAGEKHSLFISLFRVFWDHAVLFMK